MKTSTKIKTFLIIFFVVIFAIIAARHFIGLHFKKKFSVRPAPGVIVSKVEKSLFYKSIETFGTAIAQNSKTYRVQASEIAGKLKINNRFVKKGEIILTLKDGEKLIADFAGKIGKRETWLAPNSAVPCRGSPLKSKNIKYGLALLYAL